MSGAPWRVGPDLPEALLTRLFDTGDAYVLWALAKRPELPEALLTRLLDPGDVDVRCALARRTRPDGSVEAEVMPPLTTEQLLARKNHVGGSDVATLLGLSPRTPYDLYLEKTDQVSSSEPSPAMVMGTFAESGIIDWAEQVLRTKLTIGGTLECPEEPYLECNLDAYVHGTNEPVDAKLVGFGAGEYADLDEWGDSGTDHIPDGYNVQLQAQMMVTCATKAYLAAFIAGRGPCMYVIPRNNVLCMVIIGVVRKFRDAVISRTPPPLSQPSMDSIRRRIRQPGKTITVADELVTDFIMANDARKAAEVQEAHCKATLLTAMEDAEAGQYSGGTVWYREHRRTGVDLDKLKSEYPSVYDLVLTTTSYRRLTPPARKGKNA